MPASVFDTIRQRREQATEKAQADYRAMVQQMAHGAELDPDAVSRILEAAGKSPDDAEDDVAAAVRAMPPKLPPLPSPRQMLEAFANLQQIARTWLLLDSRGGTRLDLVYRELDEPGSVLTTEFVAYVDANRMCNAGFGARPAPWQFPPQPGTPGTPATAEDLLRVRVPGEQILRILGDDGGQLTIESLRSLAESLRLPFFVNARALANQHSADILREQASYAGLDAEKMLNRPPETVHTLQPRIIDDGEIAPVEGDHDRPIEDLIAELHGQGHSVASIAAYVHLPQKKVELIIASAYDAVRPGGLENSFGR